MEKLFNDYELYPTLNQTSRIKREGPSLTTHRQKVNKETCTPNILAATPKMPFRNPFFKALMFHL